MVFLHRGILHRGILRHGILHHGIFASWYYCTMVLLHRGIIALVICVQKDRAVQKKDSSFSVDTSQYFIFQKR